MSDAKIQTVPTTYGVAEYIAKLENDQQRKDSEKLVELMRKVSGKSPIMWGPSIVGFDTYHYKYDSGREGDMPRIAFAPRKGKLVLYIVDDAMKYSDIFARLGKHKTSKSCIYINKLMDIDMKTLEELISVTYKDTLVL